jgi:hypothetical protein
LEDPLKNKEILRLWRKDNPEKLREHWKKYRETHKEQRKKLSYVYSRTPGQRYYNHIRGAERRKLVNELTLSQYTNLIKSPCIYCGQVPAELNWNGVDRKDSNFGYIIENCVPCCRYCNTIKNIKSYQEWSNWIIRVRSTFTEL